MTLPQPTAGAIQALAGILGRFRGRYRRLAGAADFAAYVTARRHTDDEEILTEPILTEILEKVLGFPADAYFPQLSKSGAKPDFTPADLVAHPTHSRTTCSRA